MDAAGVGVAGGVTWGGGATQLYHHPLLVVEGRLQVGELNAQTGAL